MESGESILVLRDSGVSLCKKADLNQRKTIKCSEKWKMSLCKSIDYPTFKEWSAIDTFTDIGKKNKKFSGYIAYKNEFEVKNIEQGYVEIEDAGEDVEVFINGNSCGIKVMKPFIFDISDFVKVGKNDIQIEVATTLERERGKRKAAPIGILGKVKIYT